MPSSFDPIPAGLATLGFDQHWRSLADAATADRPHARPARVVRTDRSHVLADDGNVIGRALITDRSAVPTTGDWVLIDDLPGGAGVVTVLPRRTAFTRGAGRNDARAQVLAANLDLVLVTDSLAEAPNLGRLERYLSLAWGSGARPVVVLTKADLSNDPDLDARDVAAAAPGVDIVTVSTIAGHPRTAGLLDLDAMLPAASTAVLVGPSGAGKSSVINALAGTADLAVGALRHDGKGRHTSVVRELVVLPSGALVIDTPGLRGVQMWEATAGIAETFADLDEFVRSCRFSDCTHSTEPDCAVTRAIDTGALSPRRLASYRKLMREQAWLERRYDARLRAEERARWRTRARQMRGRGRP